MLKNLKLMNGKNDYKEMYQNVYTGCIVTRTMIIFFFFLVFLGLYLRHVEVPRLGVESEP